MTATPQEIASAQQEARIAFARSGGKALAKSRTQAERTAAARKAGLARQEARRQQQLSSPRSATKKESKTK